MKHSFPNDSCKINEVQVIVIIIQCDIKNATHIIYLSKYFQICQVNKMAHTYSTSNDQIQQNIFLTLCQTMLLIRLIHQVNIFLNVKFFLDKLDPKQEEPDRAVVPTSILRDSQSTVLLWPAKYPDRSPIEHVSVMTGRRLGQRLGFLNGFASPKT